VLLLGAKRVVPFELTIRSHSLHSLSHLVKLILLELLDNFFFRELFFFLELASLLFSVL